MRSLAVNFLVVLLTLCALAACSGNDRPKRVFSPKMMENVMHDYHLAQAMDRMNEHIDSAAVGSVATVLKKYGITQADLDSSLSYYAHHIDDLKKIYDNVNTRLTAEAEEMGIRKSQTANSFSESGDTTDIWQNVRFATISTAPLNRMTEFEIQSDTSFYQRDMFQLQAFVHFMGVPSSSEKKNSVSVGMTVVYANDSIQSSARVLQASQQFIMEVRCDTLQDIKSIYGYVAVSSPTADPVIIDGIRLLKMHRRELLKPVNAPEVGETTEEEDKEEEGE